jgi:hypothetical protein
MKKTILKSLKQSFIIEESEMMDKIERDENLKAKLEKKLIFLRSISFY